VERGIRRQEQNSYTECHFTVLGFTAANGDPVMCAVIVAAKHLTAFEACGINYLSVDFLQPESLEQKTTQTEYSHGCDSFYPMGLTCEFDNINLPCFVCCSENVSITSHMLAEMLKWMDDLGLSPRGGPLNLPNPFLLIDVHSSHFDLPLLEYINHDDHKWTTCITTPYGTNKWQVR
jgi:hypothetical protein